MKYVKLGGFAVAVFLLGWATGNSNASLGLRKFVSDTLSDSRTTAAVMSALFAVCTLLVQYNVGSKQAVIGTRQAEASRVSSEAAMLNAKNAGTRTIATLRMSWIEGLRNTISEYHSILMTADDKINADDHRRLSNLGTNLDLMLNQDEINQKKLWDVLDRIYAISDLKKRQGMDPELMEAGRAVLKAEWEKVKQEIRGEGSTI